MIINLIGALGVTANMLVYQQKSSKNLLIVKLISDFLWATHYFLLSANAAMAIAIIGIFREIVFYNQKKKWAKSNLWLVFFLSCSVVSAILTWKSFFSILPGIASFISVISFWSNNPRLSRYLAFPISVSMLIYDITCHSYMGITNDILILISATVCIIRYSAFKNDKCSCMNNKS